MYNFSLILGAALTVALVPSTFAQASGQKPASDKPLPVATRSALPPPAPLVGGSDLCTTPDVIVGAGPFTYTTVGATTGTQGQTEALCTAFNSTTLSKDVWFTWAATFTGTAAVNSCIGAGVDDRIAVYAGNTCPVAGSALACNDDTCILESRTLFNCTNGSNYLIQLGEYGAGVGISGSFTIDNVSSQGHADDCATPTSISGPGPFEFTLHGATTGTQGQGEALCVQFNQIAITNDIWFVWTADSAGLATVTMCAQAFGPTGDPKMAAYDGSGCPATAALACNDDLCAALSEIQFPVSCGQSYTIQIGKYINSNSRPTGQFSITVANPVSCNPGVPFCFGDGSGTNCPCSTAIGGSVPPGAPGNGCPNSVNAAGAHLAEMGPASVSVDMAALIGSGMPNSSCLYFQGTAQQNGGNGAVFGDGLRCAGGAVIRLGTKTNVGGTSQYPTGTDLPISVKGAVTAGDVREYQCWYRNSALFCVALSTFNLTNGVELTWGP